MRLQKYITELFNKPLEFNGPTGDPSWSTIYNFTVKAEKIYEVKFWSNDDGTYEIIFGLKQRGRNVSREDITGTGDAVAVFSTIAAIIENFVKKFKPEGLYFSAKEQSRVKLYRSLAKLITKKSYLKYFFEVKDGPATVFLFGKTNRVFRNLSGVLGEPNDRDIGFIP